MRFTGALHLDSSLRTTEMRVRAPFEYLPELINDGTGVSVSDSGRSVTMHMASAREIRYEIVNTRRPVFDIEEDTLSRLVGGREVLLVIDRRVQEIYGDAISRYAKQRLNVTDQISIEGNENGKSWDQVEQVCVSAVRLSLSRDGMIVGIGGGSTLDVAGLAAALYRRGVPYVRIPTTLVGIVDVSVGIKHAINFMGKKSILGTFYPPAFSINDLSLLRRIPAREISNGLAEIIKIAMVRSDSLFRLLEKHGQQLLQSHFQEPSDIAWQVALSSEHLMMEELWPNLFETCRSRSVDFGHTFSPKLEATTGYQISHGEAVALDMLLSARLSIERGLCHPSVFERLVNLYRAVHLPLAQRFLGAEALAGCLGEVQNHRGGAVNLVVPLAVGQVSFLQDVSQQEIEKALRFIEAIDEPTRSTLALGVTVR